MNKFSKSHSNTMAGLRNWYQKMFEELGWMVIAKSRGYDDKIMCYKNSLYRLKEAIEYRLGHHEPHLKHDLMVMLGNTNILINHVHHDF